MVTVQAFPSASSCKGTHHFPISLMNCSSVELTLMEMMSLLTRLCGPESPPWTSSDSIPLTFIHGVSSYTQSRAVPTPRKGCKREEHLTFSFKRSDFPPRDALPSCSHSLGLVEPGAWTWALYNLLITDLGRWRSAEQVFNYISRCF